MKRVKMKPVKAWVHVTGAGNPAWHSPRPLFITRDAARFALGEMKMFGWRVARIEIREVPK